MEYIEITAKTVNDAITKACMQLGIPSDRLDIQVVSEGSKGFFGIGNKPAIIRVAEKKVKEEIIEEPVKKPSKEKSAEPEKAKEESVKKETFKEKTVKEESAKKEAVKEEAAKEVFERSEESKERPRRPRNKRRDNRRKNNKKPDSFAAREPEKKAPAAEEKSEPVIKTDEEIATMKEISSNFLKEVFAAMEIPVEINMEYVPETGSLEIDFSGDDMGVLIGKRGQTLDSLQYLTSLVVNKEQKEYVRVKLDTEDYRKRRKETLENLAKNIANKVKKTRKPVVLEPMNPYERRIIHSALQPNRFVETYSDGNEPYRHIVVAPKRRERERD